MTERWRPVPGFVGCYEVSDRGRVRSLPRVIVRRNGYPYTVKPRILRPHRRPISGLVTVCLSRGRGRRGDPCHRSIHRLVADVFGDEEAA